MISKKIVEARFLAICEMYKDFRKLEWLLWLNGQASISASPEQNFARALSDVVARKVAPAFLYREVAQVLDAEFSDEVCVAFRFFANKMLAQLQMQQIEGEEWRGDGWPDASKEIARVMQDVRLETSRLLNHENASIFEHLKLEEESSIRFNGNAGAEKSLLSVLCRFQLHKPRCVGFFQDVEHLPKGPYPPFYYWVRTTEETPAVVFSVNPHQLARIAAHATGDLEGYRPSDEEVAASVDSIGRIMTESFRDAVGASSLRERLDMAKAGSRLWEKWSPNETALFLVWPEEASSGEIAFSSGFKGAAVSLE